MAEVTYADLKFMTVEHPRNQEPHEAKAKESPTPSPYWRHAAVILGIFCFGLLVTAGVLSVKFTQVSHLVSEGHENLTQKREILGNLTQQLEFLQAQNLNLSETVQQLKSYRGIMILSCFTPCAIIYTYTCVQKECKVDMKCHQIRMVAQVGKSLDAAIDKHGDIVFYFQGHRCSPCPENWLQHGENCYFLSTKWRTWQESKALCSSLGSRFLKIESKEELVMIHFSLAVGDMIQSFAYVSIQGFIIRSAQSYSSYSFWIALSCKGADGPWLWEDGRAFSTDLCTDRPFRIPEASSSLYPICVSIQGANVNTVECGSYKFCICEKVANSVGTA
ncbi:oxidized low-density lipoprotein receptor 1-like [Pangshura tecta]